MVQVNILKYFLAAVHVREHIVKKDKLYFRNRCKICDVLMLAIIKVEQINFIKGPELGEMNQRCTAALLSRSPYVTVKVQSVKFGTLATRTGIFMITTRVAKLAKNAQR